VIQGFGTGSASTTATAATPVSPTR
jgi:hypothetical protein